MLRSCCVRFVRQRYISDIFRKQDCLSSPPLLFSAIQRQSAISQFYPCILVRRYRRKGDIADEISVREGFSSIKNEFRSQRQTNRAGLAYRLRTARNEAERERPSRGPASFCEQGIPSIYEPYCELRGWSRARRESLGEAKFSHGNRPRSQTKLICRSYRAMLNDEGVRMRFLTVIGTLFNPFPKRCLLLLTRTPVIILVFRLGRTHSIIFLSISHPKGTLRKWTTSVWSTAHLKREILLNRRGSRRTWSTHGAFLSSGKLPKIDGKACPTKGEHINDDEGKSEQ